MVRYIKAVRPRQSVLFSFKGIDSVMGDFDYEKSLRDFIPRSPKDKLVAKGFVKMRSLND